MDEQSLNELLECSVCLEMLDHTSKVLPCQHTFCRRCLDEIVSTKHELRCPECRTIVEIKVEDLPTNILLVRLLEGIKTKQTNERVRSPASGRRELQTAGGGHSRQAGQPSAKALYNYEGKDHGDLSFRKGDIIILRKKIDENWFHGELNSQNGFFPSSYVQVLVPLPVTIPQCKALFDFDVNEREKDCLSFKKDEILTVIKRVDDNWVEGKKGDKIGIFPISFVEMNDAAKVLLKTKSKKPVHAASFTLKGDGTSAETGAPLSLNINPAQLASQLPEQKRHSFTASSHLSSHLKPVNIYQHHRRSLEINGSGSLVIAQSTPVQNSSISPPPFPTNLNSSSESQEGASVAARGKQSVADSSISQKQDGKAEGTDDGQSAANKVSPVESVVCTPGGLSTPVYVALYAYHPKKEDELELKKGDYFTVSDKCHDGWFRGQCLSSNKIGVFPGNYVQLVRHQSAFRAVGNANVLNIRAKPQTTAPPSVVQTSTSSVSSGVRSHQSSSVSPSRSEQSQQRRSRSPTRHSVTPPRATSSPTGASAHKDSHTGSSRHVSAKLPTSTVLSNFSSSSSSSAAMTTGSKSQVTTHTTESHLHNIDFSVHPLPAGASAHSTNHSSHKLQSSQKTGHHLRRSSSASATSHSHKSSNHHKSASSHHQHSSHSYKPVSGSSGGQMSAVNPSSLGHASHRQVGMSNHTQGYVSSNFAAIQQSMSTSASITPPNVVIGATGDGPSVLPQVSKDKKEKKEKERISLVKRLTSGKIKKSKSPGNEDVSSSGASGITSLLDNNITHVRSGSCPDTTGVLVLEGGHVKTGSFDSSVVVPPQPKPKRPNPPLKEKFRCVVPYPPQSDLELGLQVGDTVFVNKKRDDGWYKGLLQRTGKSGLFPGSFVEKVD